MDEILNLIESVSEGFPFYSLISPTKVLFYRRFIGGASVVVPQCYQQNLFNGDPSLISTYFMLRSAFMLLYRKIHYSLVLCSVLFNF